MIIRFRKAHLKLLFEGKQKSKKPGFSEDVLLKFRKTVLILKQVENVTELRRFRGLNFEALKGRLKGYYSVRVDQKHRIIFSIEKDEALAISSLLMIEDLNAHYE